MEIAVAIVCVDPAALGGLCNDVCPQASDVLTCWAMIPSYLETDVGVVGLTVYAPTAFGVASVEAVRRLRSANEALIILAALDPLAPAEEVVRAFRGGADDCFRLPVAACELAARVGARVRARPASWVLRVCGLELNGRDEVAVVDGSREPMPSLEFQRVTGATT